jgi:Myb/SANT-like DNA-binding domain
MSAKDQLKANWSVEETDALLNYLFEHQSEAVDGNNFKQDTFAAAADAILPRLRSGPEKTGKQCKTKWSSVRDYISSAFCSHH